MNHIRSLQNYDKVQSVNLKHTLEAVWTVVSMNPDAFKFTSAANHLSSLVKPRSRRELSAITSREDLGGKRSKIMKNWKIFTDYYPNWRQISKENQKIVLSECEKLGRGRKNGKKSKKSLKDWKKTVKGLKKTIVQLNQPAIQETISEVGQKRPGRNRKNIDSI